MAFRHLDASAIDATGLKTLLTGINGLQHQVIGFYWADNSPQWLMMDSWQANGSGII